MSIKLWLLILFSFIIINLKGQIQYTCGTHQIHDELIKSDTEYKKQYDRINWEIYQLIKQRIESGKKFKANPAPYVVPVVVHIITPPGTPVGQDNNISDTQVEYGLQLLNDAFANSGAFTTPSGLDIGISFCLAKRDPNGQPTNGITRHESSLVADVTPCTPFGTDMNNGGPIKAIVSWDCKEYINIWLVTDLYNSSFGCSLAGFATFPGAGCGFDGVVQESRYWITKGGATVSAHEIGHYFSLNHTFNGGCSNGDCLLDGDQVCDTPPDNSPSFAACNTNSCSTDSPDLPDDNTNYMDYTSCTPPHFTKGQKDRMIAGLEKGRPGLITSPGCQSVVNYDVALLDMKVLGGGCGNSVCTEIILKNTGIQTLTKLDIVIKIDGSIVLSYPWTGNLLSNNRDTLKLPCVTTSIGTHTLAIELKDPNGQPDGFTLNNILTTTKLQLYPKPDIKLVSYDSTHCGNNGKIIVTTTGGTSPFKYTIDSDPLKSQLSPAFYDLHNLKYSIFVVDANNCSDTLTQTIPDICPPCISGVINKYALINSFCDNATLNVDDASDFSPGDKVLIYQAQGAAVNITNTASFGNLIDYGRAGNYEFNYVLKIEGNKIILKYYLLHKYDVPALTQIITVPNLGNATVCNLTCAPWNGLKGGILVFDADTIILAGNIDVSDDGFHGGLAENAETYDPPFDGFFSNSYINGGAKGEGIAILGNNYKYAKGKIANAGGGGNDHNAGGGGGANYGAGGMGGMGLQPTFYPDIQGINGSGLNYTGFPAKVFFGGGGGAGHSNITYCGSGTSGGNGGGIAILNIKSCISNNNMIIASGQDASSPGAINGCDGAGAGGGGGAIIFNSSSGSIGLTLRAKGGNGGDVYDQQQYYLGPGGGGGGGAILTNLLLPDLLAGYEVSGGKNGILNQSIAYGATPGDLGKLIPGNQLQVAIDPYIPFGIVNIDYDTLCDNDGTVLIAAAIGTEIPEYKLDNGAWQVQGVFESINNGFHALSIKSKCLQLDTFLLISWPLQLGDSLLFLSAVNCKEKGKIGLTGVDGSPPYQYLINGGPLQTSGIFENLSAGNYSISIIDSKGCLVNKIFTIADLNITLNLLTDSFDLQRNCIDTIAYIVVHAEGSNPYYYYSLNGGPLQPSGYFKDLALGNNTIVAYDEFGCSSIAESYIVTLKISGTPVVNYYEFCEGDKIVVENHEYFSSGIYADTLITIEGCDSIIISDITIHPRYTIESMVEICIGDSIKVGNAFYSNSGNYTDTLSTEFGCDSIINTQLSVVKYKATYQNITLCKGEILQVGNFIHDLDGVYVDTLQAKAGCDSIVNTLLSIIESTNSTYSFTICDGDSITLNNKIYTKSGSYAEHLLNYLGCDSLLNIDISVLDTSVSYITISICDGDTVKVGDEIYTLPGEYKSILTGLSGCDSIVFTSIVNSNPEVCDSVTCRMYIPTGFSPNGDGINDYFQVFTPVVSITQMDIFDRWGELVTSIVSSDPKWNGKTKTGKNMHEGVYVYLIYGGCSNGKTFLKSGDVTLIR